MGGVFHILTCLLNNNTDYKRVELLLLMVIFSDFLCDFKTQWAVILIKITCLYD
jgi:hypothetical protein